MDGAKENGTELSATAAVKRVLEAVGTEALADIGAWLVAGVSGVNILESFPLAGQAEAVAELLSVLGSSGSAAYDSGQYLLGVVDGYAIASDPQRVEMVWSGPSSKGAGAGHSTGRQALMGKRESDGKY